MNLYRVTIKRPDGKFDKYHTKWVEATSMKKLRKLVIHKLQKSNWTLVSINYEREATYVVPEWPYKKQKNY